MPAAAVPLPYPPVVVIVSFSIADSAPLVDADLAPEWSDIIQRTSWRPVALASAALFAIAVVSGCGRRDAEAGGYERLTFNVDRELLQDETAFEALGFVFAAPRDWKRVDATVLDSLTTGWEHELTSGITLTVAGVYAHEESGALCTVSSPEMAGRTPDDAFLEELREAYAAKYESGTVHASAFLHGPLLAHQVLVATEDLVHLKAIFSSESTPVFAVDYVIPRTEYPLSLSSIDSSLGSVALLGAQD